jgi:hypothetical protein
MAISFKQFLDESLLALGDSAGAVWSRANVMTPWCIDAIRSFPILRPMDYGYLFVATVYSIDMPADFRQLISVEYPTAQVPPVYLARRNRLDPEFYKSASFYDIDHNYDTGEGWLLFLSGGATTGMRIRIEYLANHDLAMSDDDECFLSVPDEHFFILITSVICRAYREQLTKAMQNPTYYLSQIPQMVKMVDQVEALYQSQITAAQSRLANSIVSPRLATDKYDRVY